MIAYGKTNGLAHDLRFVADDYEAAAGEYLLEGDELPSLASLHDAAGTAALLEQELLAHCRALCAQKLAAGFGYDFGDARGVHLIGTTERDLKGWDEVRALAAAYRAAGQESAEITIATDTGAAVITAAEWPPIDIAAGAFRQPIWAASFAVQAKISAGLITTLSAIDNAGDWP